MIPKIIHYFWFGQKEIPKEHREYIKTWKKYCPDYELKLWNEKNYDIHKNQYMEQAYKAGKYGFVPDYARLDIIYQYGGFYLDTDVELLKSLDGLRKYPVVMGFEKYDGKLGVATGQGFGAEKGNSSIRMLMEIYDRRNFVRRDGTYNLSPSTVLMTRFLVNKGLVLNGKQQQVMGITILPSDYFCPLEHNPNGNRIRITDHTYSVHHFAASWVKQEQPKKISGLFKRIRTGLSGVRCCRCR